MFELQVDARLGRVPKYELTSRKGRLVLITDEIRKSVVFIGYRGKDSIELGGTAFFVSIETKRPGPIFTYLVTAKHNIVKIGKRGIDDKVYMRINTKSGSSAWIATDKGEWCEHPDDPSVDVMVFSGWPKESVGADLLSTPLPSIATEEVIRDERVGIGDEVFIVGLFRNHRGENRNLPIARIGNIAMMPEEKVRVQAYGEIDAYLIEARSIGGLSGSPVFVHLPDMRAFPLTPEQEREAEMLKERAARYALDGFMPELPNFRGSAIYLLGLIHGHWSLETSQTRDAIDDFFKEEKLNQGIAIVVPAEKILEVINQPHFKEARDRAIAKYQEKDLPEMDFDASDGAGYEREDFMGDLGKVSRPKPPSPDEGKSKTSE